jgi:raffinose/stachyose/melibiose transport system permease protein
MNYNLHRSINAEKIKIRRKKFLKENIQAYTLMLPTLILFAALTIYPIVWSLKYSFYDYDGASSPLFIGLKNFKDIFNFKAIAADPNGFYGLYWQSWGKTFLYVLIKTAIEIPVSFICAYIIYKKIRGAAFFKTLFYLPQILPAMVMSMVFLIMLNPTNGALHAFMVKLGIIETGYSFFAKTNSAFLTGILVDVWFYFGLNMLLFISGFANVSKEVHESADVDGANEFQKVFYVTIPMMVRIIQVIVMLSILGALRSIGSYFILTQGGPNHGTELTFLYIYNIFFNGSAGSARYGYGAAVAVVSAVIIGIITFIYNKVTSKFLYD